jgi:phospholipid transport system transporter-binding protein
MSANAFQPTDALTVNNAEAALDVGLQAIRDGQTEIDLAGLTVVDSAAVATLLEWKRAARENNLRLVFRNVPDSVISLARLYGVAELLDCPQRQAA